MADVEEPGAIREACRQLLYRYAIAVDAREWDKVAACFVPDLIWRRPGMEPMRSHQDVLDFFHNMEARRAQAHPNRHLMTTISVEVESADRARSVAYALVYRDPAFGGDLPSPMPDGPELVVEYKDVFARTADGWRIGDHEAIHVFRAPFYNQPPMLRATEVER